MVARFDLAITPAEVVVRKGDAELARYPLALDGDPATTTTVDALRAGTATAAAVRALGERLYAALIAPARAAIEAGLGDATVIELGLWFAKAPALAGLPWEMMRDPDGFLAAGVLVGGKRVDVVITRRFERARVATPALAAPLRYLFAIGTELGDAVRAGAECLGLLRQIGPEIQERIVERQSVSALANEIAALEPHVVHLICHGRETATGGIELAMWDDDRGAATFVGAAELCDRLVQVSTDGRRAPAMAILSACSSGARLACPGGTDFASSLVAAGVPIVIGMAAEISDLGCRLFTRRFGEAMVERRPLLVAAALGRAAALRATQMPDNAFDWGLIQLALGDDVDAALAVAAPAPDSDDLKMMSWLRKAELPIDLGGGDRVYPPLCATTDVLEGFYQLVRNPNRSVLALVAYPPRPLVRVGLSRACAEVAALAIRAGHVPVLVNLRSGGGDPAEPRVVVQRLAAAFRDARKWRGLPVDKLALDAIVAGTGAIDDAALRDAVERDAAALQQEARAAHAMIARARGETVLLFHDVHRYAQGAETVLGLCRSGGGIDDRVLVVIGWAMLPPAAQTGTGRRSDRPDPWRASLDERLNEWLATGRRWIGKIELRPLDERAARLAYQRVLLHPFRHEPAIAGKPLFLDLASRDEAALAVVLRRLKKGSEGGCAGQFDDEDFYDYVEEAIEEKSVLRSADDDDLLAAWRKPP